MSDFTGLLSFILFIGLIVGLINPSLILKKSKKPTRIKVFGLWVLSSLFIAVLSIATFDYKDKASLKKIETAEKYITEGKYSNAKETLNKIGPRDSLYLNAQLLVKEIDSIDEALILKKKEKEISEQKQQLKREISSIEKGLKIGKGETIEELQIDIILFGAWAKMIKTSEESEIMEIKKLGQNLKKKVINIQIKEFPNLRDQYSKIVSKKMWEYDINVRANGSGKKYINFTGGLFAANKNKKDFQNQLEEMLNIFRFKQSRYRWYKGADEYTYYTIYSGKDSDLVTF